MTDTMAPHEYFEMVYRQTAGRLSQYVLFKAPGLAESEDIVATVYTDFFQYISLKNRRPDNVYSYLIQMANHELSRYYTRHRRLLSLDDESIALFETVSDGQDLEETILDQHDTNRIWSAVLQLSWPEQQVLTARFRFDMTFSEIASWLEQSENTVRLRYYRSLKKLSKILSKL